MMEKLNQLNSIMIQVSQQHKCFIKIQNWLRNCDQASIEATIV